MFARLTPAVKTLLLVNIIIFAAGYLLDMSVMLNRLGGLVYVGSANFRVHQIISYMFLHGDFWHLFGNMFALFIFGPFLEGQWGSQRFMTYYLITGLGAGILFGAVDYYETSRIERAIENYETNPNPNDFSKILVDNPELIVLPYNKKKVVEFLNSYNQDPQNRQYQEHSVYTLTALLDNHSSIPMVGASGAIFGIIIAMALLFPNLEFMLIIPPIPVKMKYIAMVYGGFEIYQQMQNIPGDNVAHLAHIGGMLVGYILIRVWYGRNYRIY